jgi:hypothetical protein
VLPIGLAVGTPVPAPEIAAGAEVPAYLRTYGR